MSYVGKGSLRDGFHRRKTFVLNLVFQSIFAQIYFSVLCYSNHHAKRAMVYETFINSLESK